MRGTKKSTSPGQHDFVVVANRLPVDRVTGADGTPQWRRSPGGLVTALAPTMQSSGGAWVGWHGGVDEPLDEFDEGGIHQVPVPLSASELRLYYEGFSNATLWPLYHDVIVPPEFHRTWWVAYREVNARFARAAAATAAHGATVWVHDYQLQLVPRMLRDARPDLRIGFFNHIPFPPAELFAQLPWRARILEGLLGADLIGFQRASDTANFLTSVRRFLGVTARKGGVQVPGTSRVSRAETHPISIDAAHIAALAQDPDVRARAVQIRVEMGDPETVLLGVDRLDYTKGIRHRLKAYAELLDDGVVQVGQTGLIQIASPSREKVDSYQQLREEVEGTVGRINGEYDSFAATAVRYLHHSYPVEEMVALYLAADVMLVTPLRDGMNLVAKEYVMARGADGGGRLVLSEFAGAADQLRQAIIVSPHDIDGLKAAIMSGIEMAPPEAKRRMSSMRRTVESHDVNRWSREFLDSLMGNAPGTTEESSA
ncbi:alpha,alpha-trehalose-phosphate synthase (UDP-forming) [Galactobacter caseinivorans]|uniref:Trehalose-6-phosphate synthase n=1 Tax=Galactobacter caseinivorans TaxID=2676123 RepID=A0A496PG39_9MICC|nr:trehalose-6-phosphate synthase [Galactobacter caseinivorans]RKW69425.1 trehalose-6-phosphate synthase [Galactobacter caseinivorans]